MSAAPVALIIGGSGAVGSAVARRLAAEGYLACVHYATQEAAAARVVEEIAAAGGRAFANRADLADPAQVDALLDAARAHGALSVLVNAAAQNKPKPLRFVTDADLEATLAVDVVGAFRCVRGAAKHMARVGGGAIIGVGSLSARLPTLGQLAYATAKAALEGMTRAAALELAPFGITVNLVEPGPLEGGMQTLAGGADATRLPTGRLPTTASVAACVAYLASGEGRHVTGQVLTIDGGLGLTSAMTPAARGRHLSGRRGEM